MSVEKIVRFLKGYVVICAEGHFCERFLNICMRRGIYLSDVKRMGDEKLRASISIGAFKEIRSIARKTKTHISVTARCGMPFVLHRYRKRRAAVVGVVLFLGILWYLTSHVMGIDVSGNQRIPTEQIISGLDELGVRHGASVRSIDDETVKNRMMTKFDDIAWIGVSVKGSRVYVEIKERLDTDIRLDTDVPCDIIAERDGVVKLLEIKEGRTVVAVNQFVEKGDLLVSGVMDSQVKGMRFVHSFGEVYAETSYKKSGEYSFEYTEKIYTGGEKRRYSVSVLGRELKLYFKDTLPFENCEVSEISNEYKAPLSFIPSLFVRSKSYSEYETVKKKRSVEDAVSLGSEELGKALESELPPDAEPVDKKITYSEGEKGVLVEVEFICREDIGSQRIIDKTELLEYDIVEKE